MFESVEGLGVCSEPLLAVFERFRNLWLEFHLCLGFGSKFLYEGRYLPALFWNN